MVLHKDIFSRFVSGIFILTAVSSLSFWGCAEEGTPSPHINGWADSTSESFHALKIANSGIESCAECHGSDYKGGASEVSCYICHEGGQSGHPAYDLWIDSPESNLFHAQAIITRGWEACQECHGENYRGGISGVSCYTCHSGGESGHPALVDWINPQSPDYHGRVLWDSNWDFDRCKQCHGTDLNAGGTARGCQSTACHAAPAGIYDCDNCHTTNVTTTFYDVKNNSSTSEVTVGAHVSHVLASHDLSSEIECGECHIIPDSVFTSGHLDATQKIVFGNLATAAGNLSPVWARTTATCANTYCHGEATPVWTNSSGSDRYCTSCHGQPPLVGAHVTHVNELGLGCSTCHSGYNPMIDAGAADSTHINGTVNVNISTDYGTNAAYSNSSETCSNVYCHGIGEPIWSSTPTFNCTSCHGGLDNSTGAPPYDLSGNTNSSAFAVGAHTVHLTDSTFTNPIACNECHVVPVSVSAAGHFDTDLTAEINFGELATDSGRVTPVWDSSSGTCSNVYCHGNFAFLKSESTNQSAYADTIINGNNPTLDWTASGSVVCGTCHGQVAPDSPVPAGHTSQSSCGCHFKVVDSNLNIIGKEKHINGQKNVFGN